MTVVTGEDGVARCSWGVAPEEYRVYHDSEWGFPVGDDRVLFEKICLEGFQSGLSWLTVLRKREDFRRVFHGFDFNRVASMGETEVVGLLQDPRIIRHRGKIEATINNARCLPPIAEEFGSFAAYAWGFEPTGSDPGRSTSPESIAMSKDLKRRGFRFVGPTTVYAFMQAMGLVNDHERDCHIAGRVDEARSNFLVGR